MTTQGARAHGGGTASASEPCHRDRPQGKALSIQGTVQRGIMFTAAGTLRAATGQGHRTQIGNVAHLGLTALGLGQTMFGLRITKPSCSPSRHVEVGVPSFVAATLNPPRLIAGEQLGRRPSPRLILEINIELLPVGRGRRSRRIASRLTKAAKGRLGVSGTRLASHIKFGSRANGKKPPTA